MSEATSAAIVNRIRKLLALAGNNSNEHEAAAAAEKAQALMEEYSIDVACFEAANGTTEAREKETTHNFSAVYDWQQRLMAAVAQSYMVFHEVRQVNTTKGGKPVVSKRHFLIGRKVNVELTKETYAYLFTTMNRLLPYPQGESLSRSAHSWRLGCAERLAQRLQEKRVDAIRESRARQQAAQPTGPSDGKSLVVSLGDVVQQEMDANLEALYGYEPGTMARERAKWAARRAEAAAQPQAPRVDTRTEAEKARAAKLAERNERAWRRKREREASKIDWAAFDYGARAGSQIGLDTQVKGGFTKKIG